MEEGPCAWEGDVRGEGLPKGVEGLSLRSLSLPDQALALRWGTWPGERGILSELALRPVMPSASDTERKCRAERDPAPAPKAQEAKGDSGSWSGCCCCCWWLWRSGCCACG